MLILHDARKNRIMCHWLVSVTHTRKPTERNIYPIPYVHFVDRTGDVLGGFVYDLTLSPLSYSCDGPQRRCRCVNDFVHGTVKCTPRLELQ